MSRSRAGRKAYETRINFNNQVGDFFRSLANAPEPKFGRDATKAMIIERVIKETKHKEVITFGEAYGELSMWFNVAFANISPSGLSDMLAETFFQGAAVHTPKAVYRLWTRTGH